MSNLKDTIKEIQQKLKNEGYGLKIDGVFGPLTAEAMNEFIDSKWVKKEPPQTEHFTIDEWRCNDGSLPLESMWLQLQKLMNRLEELRAALGNRPIYILSGYRSQEYNAQLYERSQRTGGGGVAKNSPHMRCTAADIRVKGKSSQEVFNAADEIFKEGGVGIYHTSNFVHVDLDCEKSGLQGGSRNELNRTHCPDMMSGFFVLNKK